VKNIIKAMEDPQLLRPAFKDLRTWRPWMTYLKALFGLGLEGEEIELFRESTGLGEASAGPVRESFAIVGRRGGKSYISAVIACYLAGSRDWRKVLGRGEKARLFIIAVDRAQAKIIRDYCASILEASPRYRRLIEDMVRDEIRLKNGAIITIKTASFRSVRGYSVALVIAEELAFWRSEDSANPDIELLRAVRPSLETIPGSLLLGISTPYAKSGALYQAFKDNFGKPGGPLIWKASSLTMNSTLRPRSIERALEDDPEGARAEWLAEFRQDISGFIPAELIESLIIPGRLELPAERGIKYQAFADPSGGSSDSFALAIAHRSAEGGLILDCLREKRVPFSAQETVREFAETLRAYNLSSVRGDRYAGEWPRQAFGAHGIEYQVSEKVSSELFGEALPLFTSSQVELLDQKRLRAQLSNLERRVRPGGRDAIGHGPGAHDDLAVCTAGAVLMAARSGASRGRVYVAGVRVSGPPVEVTGPAKRRVFFSKRPEKIFDAMEIIRNSLARGRKPPPDDD